MLASFKASPVSAQLFIIYADREMGNYTARLNADLINIGEMLIRNAEIEFRLSEFGLALHTRQLCDTSPERGAERQITC